MRKHIFNKFALLNNIKENILEHLTGKLANNEKKE